MDNGIMPRSVIKNTPLGLPLRNTITVSIHCIKAWRTVWVRHTWKRQQCMTALSALHKGGSCRKEGGSTTYWPECASMCFTQTADTKKCHRLQRGKDRLFGILFALKMKENKSAPMQYCPREEHCQSCKPVYNHFADLQVTRTPVLRGAWAWFPAFY